jgi:hypothetical protein
MQAPARSPAQSGNGSGGTVEEVLDDDVDDEDEVDEDEVDEDEVDEDVEDELVVVDDDEVDELDVVDVDDVVDVEEVEVVDDVEVVDVVLLELVVVVGQEAVMLPSPRTTKLSRSLTSTWFDAIMNSRNGKRSRAAVAAPPSPWYPRRPVPATVSMVPPRVKRRTRWLLKSVNQIAPVSSIFTSIGSSSWAAVAGPPLPLNPATPVPATVVIICVSASTRRMRWLWWSAM